MRIINEGLILQSRGLGFEERGVFNPTCVSSEGKTIILYRANAKDDISSVGYAEADGSRIIKRLDYPVLIPSEEYDIRGIEDPSVTQLEGKYFMIYIAVDKLANARLALASSENLLTWEKLGLVGPNITYGEARELVDWEKVCPGYTYFANYFEKNDGADSYMFSKSGCLFPKRFDGKIAMLHRMHPGIQLIFAKDTEALKSDDFWRSHFLNLKESIVMDPKLTWEGEVIGMGSVPIETKDGWLLIYYGSTKSAAGRMFRVGAALLDLINPRREIGRLQEPLFEPTENWEKSGNVDNVVFPSGAIIREDRLWIYYGAADKAIGARSINTDELLTELKKCKIKL